ncbi:DUF386 family protein [Spirosoma endbachense]|uniref:DUF386 family protein n=1 Tax=Spirosoma endbachense TaxID=2666025 RepID=A0A6P1W961_9BACT|nr:DUF386 family protein [Spirosoma endbachense]
MNVRMLAHLLIVVCSLSYQTNAQSNETWTGNQAIQWYTKMEWLNGLAAKPGDGINPEEFAKRYHANQAGWEKAFAFLKNTDFTRLRPGKYPIDDENVFATISEGPPRELSNSKWEAHQTFSDIHFVVKGKEKIGIIPVQKIKLNVAQEYNSARDIAFYTTEEGKFYVAEPGVFYIVTPTEAHNPSNKVDGYDGVKKVVVKVRITP